MTTTTESTKPSVDMSELQRGDELLITPFRHYGTEEQPGEQPWTAYVWSVDVDRDEVFVVRNVPAGITDPTPCGQIVKRKFVGLVESIQLIKRNMGQSASRVAYRIDNANPTAKRAAVKAEADKKINELLHLANSVENVSYARREERAAELRSAVMDLAESVDALA